MEELIKLVSVFRETLLSMLRVYEQLLLVLDEEEDLISRYELSEFEKTITKKDQFLQRAQRIEAKRIQVLSRICFLIAYDSRGQSPTLTEFKILFNKYLDNVSSLLDANTFVKLQAEFTDFITVADDFAIFYKTLEPRIYRNKKIIKSVLSNISRSVAIVTQALDPSLQYGANGKTRIKSDAGSTTSSLRVSV